MTIVANLAFKGGKSCIARFRCVHFTIYSAKIISLRSVALQHTTFPPFQCGNLLSLIHKTYGNDLSENIGSIRLVPVVL